MLLTYYVINLAWITVIDYDDHVKKKNKGQLK